MVEEEEEGKEMHVELPAWVSSEAKKGVAAANNMDCTSTLWP